MPIAFRSFPVQKFILAVSFTFVFTKISYQVEASTNVGLTYHTGQAGNDYDALHSVPLYEQLRHLNQGRGDVPSQLETKNKKDEQALSKEVHKYDPMVIFTNKSQTVVADKPKEKTSPDSSLHGSSSAKELKGSKQADEEKQRNYAAGSLDAVSIPEKSSIEKDEPSPKESLRKVAVPEMHEDSIDHVETEEQNDVAIPHYFKGPPVDIEPTKETEEVDRASPPSVNSNIEYKVIDEPVDKIMSSNSSQVNFIVLIVSIGFICAFGMKYVVSSKDLARRKWLRQMIRRGCTAVLLAFDSVPMCSKCTVCFRWVCSISLSGISFQRPETRVKATKGNVKKRSFLRTLRQYSYGFFSRITRGDGVGGNIAETEKLNKNGAMASVDMIQLKERSTSGRFIPKRHFQNMGFRSVLSQKCVLELLPHLPVRISCSDWSLAYASELHGYSLYATYRACEKMNGPCLLVIMDTQQHVFGVFCSEPLHLSGGRYYGTGETFLVKFHPTFEVYKWSGMNSQFIIGTQDMLAFGGGGKFALWLDSSFEKGTSESGSPTFDSPCIASSENFKCVAVELWSFVNYAHMLKQV